ncbi:MAG: NAD(P)H-dependent oxidoreductase subunit E [Clostridiales bacterium]|jgi:NADH:ubiquinone oxidoreductase subunit E|nr:NAD(P)H-dependent oxidoreductase subunit E [Clostridiales bacterium]
MAKIKLTKVPFKGTPEQAQALTAALNEIKNKQGAVMPALQKAQEIYGYLPIEVQLVIAEALGVSAEEVFGVATFYSQFTLNPRGTYNVSVCMGTACYVKGAGDVLEALKKKLGIETDECTLDSKFSLNATRCIGCCGLAPVMTVNETVYGKVTTNEVDGILKNYL